jgi:polyvinyl alcohol dehydrogenase (cytochrome)
LSSAEIQAVASYLTSGGTGETAIIERRMLNLPPGPVGTDPMCTTNTPFRPGPSDWTSAGFDDAGRRFQPHPGLTAADLPKLKLKWAFSMTGGGQPTVIGDWLFTTNRSGALYALDTKTGCVHWVVKGVVSRTTPMIVRSPVSPSGWITYVGETSRTVHAFDAVTGRELWVSDELETHPSSVLTGSPIVSGDTVFVPISSIEEASSMSKDYACCTFRGSLAALDARTGKLLWKTYTIQEPAHPTDRKNAAGKTLTGPAGAAVWASPSVDPKRGLVYIVSGDSYTDEETDGDDAVFAIEMKTGKIRWRHQVTQGDNFVMGCGPKSTTGNCPTPMGPDYDFGATPILFKAASGKAGGGKEVLLAGQKSGIVYGFEPSTGKLLWKTQVGNGSALGGVEWGMGADDKRLYVPISDIGLLFRFGGANNLPPKAGLYGLDPLTGKILWSTPSPAAPCHYAADKDKPSTCVRAQSAAPAVIPGLVFSGTTDGWFRAYDSKTGKILWEYSTTAQTYDTVNGIKGQPGGGLDGMGPVVSNGMVFVMSGFNGAARVGSNGVNVLLAFGRD